MTRLNSAALMSPNSANTEVNATLTHTSIGPNSVSARAVAAVRDWDAQLGPDAVWVACSHGDLIKSVVADAMGAHLDLFQRIIIDPGSVTAIRYTDTRPFLLKVNDTGGDVAAYRPPEKRRGRGDAVVGGGAGPKS